MSFTVKFIYIAHHFILARLNSFDVSLWLIESDDDLNTVCHSSGFACQQSVLKMFTGPAYLLSKDEEAWLCHSLINLLLWLTISSCYSSIPLTLV